MIKYIYITVMLCMGFSNIYAQDTCTMLRGSMQGKNFIVSDTIYYLCDTVTQPHKTVLIKGKVTRDTVTSEYKGYAGGQQDSLTVEQKEVQMFLDELKKIDTQITELQKSREQIIGILMYLSKKYNIKIQ